MTMMLIPVRTRQIPLARLWFRRWFDDHMAAVSDPSGNRQAYDFRSSCHERDSPAQCAELKDGLANSIHYPVVLRTVCRNPSAGASRVLYATALVYGGLVARRRYRH